MVFLVGADSIHPDQSTERRIRMPGVVDKEIVRLWFDGYCTTVASERGVHVLAIHHYVV
jgi:hypothetical protein